MADLYVCPEPDCGRTYPDADAFARHCDIAEHGDPPCPICGQPADVDHRFNAHGPNQPRREDDGPYIGSYAASDPWSDARDNRRDD